MALEIPTSLNNHNDIQVDVDQSLWKLVVLGALTVSFAFAFSYALKILLQSRDKASFLATVIFGIGFLVFFLLNTLFIKSQPTSHWIIGLEAIALLLGFYDSFSKYTFLGGLLAFVSLAAANYAGVAELRNLVKLKFWRVSKRVLPKAILASAFFAGFAYYGHIQALDWIKPEQFFISESTFEKIVAPVAPAIQRFVPEFDLSINTGKFLNQIAADQVASNPAKQNLSPEQKRLLIDFTAQDLKTELGSYLGQTIDTSSTVGILLYDGFLAKLSEAPDNVRSNIPLGAAAAVFLAIVAFTWLIRWVATLIAWILFEASMAVGFSILMAESKSREIVVLK